MSEPLRHPQYDPRPGEAAVPSQRPPRGLGEDPLAELARILGEGVAHPARPEHMVEVGRRANPGGRPAPQQLSDLEAALFEELRSSVAPEDRVRGVFEREIPAIIPQHPVDDHDIASLSAFSAPAEAEAAPAAPQPAVVEPATATEGPDPRWADYYAYDEDGVSAGSYDPAFASSADHELDLDAAFAAEIHRARGGEAPRPTFEDFDQQAITAAAREASPYVSDEVTITPHSRLEADAAGHLAQDRPRGGFKVAAALVGIVLAGGAAIAGWKTYGDPASSGPVLVHADAKPFKVLPDPTKSPQADTNEPTLKRDNAVSGSKIVSLQEDPVEQVSGRTPEGREVRVINPGAQRSASPDQPHTVKTVVVRPDGSIVSDGAQVRGPTVTPPAEGPSAAPAPAVSAVPPVAAAPPTAGSPARTASVPVVPVPTVPTTTATTATAPAAVPKPVATTPIVPKAVTTTPVTAPAVPSVPAPVKTVTTTPVVPPAAAPAKPAATPPAKPVTTTQITPPAATRSGAPMALGPVAPKLAAAAPPPAPPVAAPPKPTTAPVALTPPPAAPAGGGDWAVQISASKSDADARKSLADAQRRFSALSGRSGDVQRADLGAKGTFYRARVPAGSREQAAALCSQIQSQGGQCMVVRR